MQWDLEATIAALASAPGSAARGLIRISGPLVKSCLQDVFLADDPVRFDSARFAECHTGRVRYAAHEQTLPALLYCWPNERSYTAQPMAEIHTVGSPPLLDSVLAELFSCGAQPANPGEFTLRAFLAGRIDLVQAEAVLGVVDAPDHVALETALGQLAGGISGTIRDVRDSLLNLLADVEAGLDFVEEDINFVTRDESLSKLEAARQILDDLLGQASSRMQTTGRVRVVLAGLPNAGKSSLFNALLEREAALVSQHQGTTRDYLHADVRWNGIGIELIDTAGWDVGGSQIEQTAQQLRSEQLDRAHVIIWCTDSELEAAALERDEQWRSKIEATAGNIILARTKCDIDVTHRQKSSVECPNEPERKPGLPTSARTRYGLQRLRDKVSSVLCATQSDGQRMLGTTASRCRQSLAGAATAVENASEAIRVGHGDELLAIEIRAALAHLGSLLGAVYTDDILDRIFSRFCIGK